MLMEESVLKEKLAKSLTAEDTNLIPFLPYLLQDLWELGSNPKDIIQLMKENLTNIEEMVILDLACGKGAVAIMIAKELKVKVKGVDIISEFIEFAKMKALEFKVSDSCCFNEEDINKTILKEKDYDCVIYGAANDILGSPKETLMKLKRTIKSFGYIIIDDVYLDINTDEIHNQSYSYLTLEQWKDLFQEAGITVVDSIVNNVNVEQINFDTQLIVTRAMELIQQYPQHKKLLEDYVESQKCECMDLESNLVGVTWLLQLNE